MNERTRPHSRRPGPARRLRPADPAPLRHSDRLRPLVSARGAGAVLVAVHVGVILLAAGAGATPQLETRYGGQNVFLAPQHAAMGGTGVAVYRGALSTVLNPAMLAVETGTRIDVAAAVDNQHEDRFQPLFDSFDSYVADAAIASNRHHYWSGNYGVARRVLAGETALVLGLSVTDRRPYSYTFQEELRDPDPFAEPRDRILQEREREVTGTLRDLSLGAGMVVTERVSLGLALHYAFGTREEIHRVRDYDDATNSYYAKEHFELSGVHASMGLRVAVNERFTFGVAWDSPLEADGDLLSYRVDADGEEILAAGESRIDYPNAVRFGVELRPRNDPRTIVAAEAEWTNWNDLGDERLGGDGKPPLHDTWDIRTGVEHRFYNDFALRFGFRRHESYADREVGTSVFAAGVGVPLSGGRLATSVEISKTTAVLPHQFPYPDDFLGPQYQADPEARVDDTRFRFGVGYSGSF